MAGRLRYTIDPETRVVLLTATGEPTFDEVHDTHLAVFRDPRYEPGFAFLVDWLRAKSPSALDVHNLAAFLRANHTQLRGARIALVIKQRNDTDMTGLAQSLFAEIPLSLEIFTDRDEAVAWLRKGS